MCCQQQGRHLPNIVNKFHRVARNQEQIGAHGQEAMRIMRGFDQQEMAALIGKTKEEAKLNRRERRQASHRALSKV